MRYSNVGFLLFLFTTLCSQVVLSHEAGITDTGIEISQDSLKLTYTVPQKLVARLALGSTPNDDASQSAAILKGFVIANDGNPCRAVAIAQRSLDTIASAQFDFQFDCTAPITRLNIHYKLLYDQQAAHSNIVRISLLGRSQDVTLSADNPKHVVDVQALVMQIAAARNADHSQKLKKTGDSPYIQRPFGTHFFPIGLQHILFGFDHVIFLFCLILLPMRPVVLLTMITSFTIAHSITISLSVLDFVTLPPRIVETVIALSIVYVSVRTIAILRTSAYVQISTSQIRERLLSSFVFGLIHGFGFSYVLKEIGLGEQAFLSLLFFNLGVEAGQLIILSALLPLIWWLGKRFPSWHWARGASLLTGLIGSFWLIERLVIQ